MARVGRASTSLYHREGASSTAQRLAQLFQRLFFDARYVGTRDAEGFGDLVLGAGRAVEKAVKGMLPHNSLGRAQFKKLHVYAGPEHPHAGQSPVPYELTQVAQ